MPLSHSQTNQLLQNLGHEPRKQLGQNFLIDGNIVMKSLKLADLKAGETVVEIGPGLGTLTEAMLEKGAHVYAVEFDRTLHRHLSESLLPRYAQTFNLIHADAVDQPLAALPVEQLLPVKSEGVTEVADVTAATDTPEAARQTQTLTGEFKIIANLPYAISTPWLERVLSGPLRPRRLVLMLQKEAAERFIAAPGSKTFGAISIFTASAYRVSGTHAVSRQCFYPIPGVDSMLLSLEALPSPQPWSAQARTLARSFFTQRRKQIGSLVRQSAKHADASTAERLLLWLDKLQALGISTETRPEAIALVGWYALSELFPPTQPEQA